MKKILFLHLIGLIPILINAQDVAFTKMPATTLISNTSTGEPTNATKVRRREARENKQMDKANKLFNRDFKNASNVNWTTGANEFTASFTKDGMSHVAWYNKSGGLRYTMVSYGADKLPAEAQRAVRNAYDGYNITWVNEVHENDVTVYVVHLENDREIKLVTVCNGDTNLYKQYRKQ